jgi:membrane fusion protein (multidrug efflux system)
MAQETEQPPVIERTEEAPASEVQKAEGEHSWVRRVSRRRSKSGRLILIIVVLVVLVGAFFLWRYFSSYESTDDAQVDVHLYPVSARVSGYVIKVNVNDNQYVERGTVLVEIDPRDYQVAVDKARADVANAEATARSLNITVPITSVSTSSQLTFSVSDVEGARAGVIAAE